MLESIENDFESLKQKSKYACWAALKQTCEQQGVVAPSYRAFRRAVGKRSQLEQTLKRKAVVRLINTSQPIGIWISPLRGTETGLSRSATSTIRNWTSNFAV